MRLSGKIILITGASAGIGEALARKLAPQASTLILVARRREKLEQLGGELLKASPNLRVLLFDRDISDRQNQLFILEELQQGGLVVDLLINNAGVGDESQFHQSDWQRVENMIDLNAKSVMSFTHLLLPQLLAQPQGRGIVFVASGAGIAWMPGSLAYTASKHFVSAMAVTLRAELQPQGLQVNLVAPGPVETEFDQAAGIEGGLKSGPGAGMRISASECAEEIIRGIERDQALILPGKKYRRLMNFYLLLPWGIRRRVTEKEGRKLIQ